MREIINITAADWAWENAGETYQDLSEDQRIILRDAVSTFVKKPGYAIGDVIKLLLPYFPKERAESIAITEITRAYAHAAQTKGEQLKKEWNDVKVIKTWYTNNDNYVCPICQGLEGKKVVIENYFAENIFIPPAHEGCRCWISSNTELFR